MTIKDKNSPDFGKTKKYQRSNDWVEENFTAESLAIIQQIAKETTKEFQVRGTSKKEQGFIHLQGAIAYKHNKVDLQISRMRYLPPRKIFEGGVAVWLEGVWRGWSCGK